MTKWPSYRGDIKSKMRRTRRNQSHEAWERAFQASKQAVPSSQGKKELACSSNCSSVAGAEHGAGGELGRGRGQFTKGLETLPYFCLV